MIKKEKKRFYKGCVMELCQNKWFKINRNSIKCVISFKFKLKIIIKIIKILILMLIIILIILITTTNLDSIKTIFI